MSLFSALSGETYRTLDAARQRVLPPEPVQAGQESGQRFAGAGRGEDERVLARGDGRPALPLRLRRLAERCAKPLPHRRQKQIEGIGQAHPYIVATPP